MARTTKADSEKVQAAILEAAGAEIAHHGYQGLRIPAVAKRIGKTQGAVYGRFPDKETLALAAIRHLRDELVMPQVMLELAEAKSPVEALEGVSRAIAKVAVEHPEGQLMFARLASEMAGQPGPLADEVRSLFDSFATTLRGLVQSARDRGMIHADIDARVFAYAVVGLPIMFSTMACMFRSELSYEELESQLRPVLTRGVSAIT